MPSVLVTAFEPYDRWPTNASWQCLLELTREMPAKPAIATRRYPVDFTAARARLAADLAANYDYALHLGQAPGSSQIRLEAFALNVGGAPGDSPDKLRPLAEDGPAAYRSALPLADWAARLRAAGLPAAVSHHAGTYLCNATLYWTHYLAERMGLKTKAAFVHLPLETAQAASEPRETPSLPAPLTAAAVRLILEQLAT